MIGKLSLRLQGWKTTFLSFGGKITVILPFLVSLSVHIMSYMDIPNSLIARMEGIMKWFLWSQNSEKPHWLSWKTICLPIHHEGLGIRSLKETLFCMQGKLASKVLSSDSLWARILKTKYGIDKLSREFDFHHSASRLWCKLVPHFQTLNELVFWHIEDGKIVGMAFGRTQWKVQFKIF